MTDGKDRPRDSYERFVMPLWRILFGWTLRFRRASKRYATCCGVPLSEWFIWKDTAGWGMQCWFCKRVSPWLTHDEYREEIANDQH